MGWSAEGKNRGLNTRAEYLSEQLNKVPGKLEMPSVEKVTARMALLSLSHWGVAFSAVTVRSAQEPGEGKWAAAARPQEGPEGAPRDTGGCCRGHH